MAERVRLIHGDAMRAMRGMDACAFDGVITDPPYASGRSISDRQASTAVKYLQKKKGCRYPEFDGDAMDARAWTNEMIDVLREARRLCKPGAVVAAFIDWRSIPSMSDALQRAGWMWMGVAVWDKTAGSRPQKGRFRQQTEFILWGANGRLPIDRPVPVLPGVFRYANVPTGERIHQVQKPLELMREIVRFCVPGGAVLDPFAGSGTTLLAAAMEGHPAVGIESNAMIARQAADRLGLTEQPAQVIM